MCSVQYIFLQSEGEFTFHFFLFIYLQQELQARRGSDDENESDEDEDEDDDEDDEDEEENMPVDEGQFDDAELSGIEYDMPKRLNMCWTISNHQAYSVIAGFCGQNYFLMFVPHSYDLDGFFVFRGNLELSL